MNASIIGYAVGYSVVPTLIMFPIIYFGLRRKIALTRGRLTKSSFASWGITTISAMLWHNIVFMMVVAGFASYYFIRFFSTECSKTSVLEN